MSKQKTALHVKASGAPRARTLPRWEELPDFELYMDQMLSLMERYLGGSPLAGEKGVTASMVNNYVKTGLLPAPRKKKYARMHLACLIVVCALKPVLPLAAIQALLAEGLDQGDPEPFYNRFCERFEKAELDAVEQFESAEREAATGGLAEGESAAIQAASVAAALSAQAHQHVALSSLQG